MPRSFARLIYTPQKCPGVRRRSRRDCRPHQVNDQQMSRSIPQPLQLDISRKSAKTVPLKLSEYLDKIHFIITPNTSLDSVRIAVQESAILVNSPQPIVENI